MKKKLSSYGTKKLKDMSELEIMKINEFKNRFSRWHDKQINLLTFCINLVFTISIAISGFVISSNELFKGKMIFCNYPFVKTILIILGISITLGVAALFVRLCDFRLTRNLIKTRRRIYEISNDIKYEDYVLSKESEENKIKERLKCKTKNLGNITWGLFYLQAITLIISFWIIILNSY